MPAGAIIGAAGSVAGGIASGKGAKKAARIQAQSAREQRALLQKLYNQNEARLRPEFEAGSAATERLMALLGMSNGKERIDPSEIFRATPGYQFRMSEALRGVNSNAYARGLGNSGATQRALMTTAQGVADQGFNNYFGQVSSIADRGLNAKATMGGLSTDFGNNTNRIAQNAADTASEYQMFKAANFNNTLGGILQSGLLQSAIAGKGGVGGNAKAFGSSFGSQSSVPHWRNG